MRITRLYLRNYRVFGDELDLPMPAGLVGIYGVNGAGKCLPGSTRVWDADRGEAVPIERFVAEERKWILGYRDGRVERVPVTDWMQLGERPLVRVELASGALLDAASTHPVLTDRGCVRAGDLRPGDWVAEARRMPALAPDLLTEDEALLVGLLLGDGCVVDRPTLSAMDDEVRSVFRRVVESTFPACTTRVTHRSTCCVVSDVVGADRRELRRSLAASLTAAGVDLEAYLGTNVARFVRGESSPSWETLVAIEDDHGLDLWPDKCALHGRRALLEWVKERGLLGHNAFSKSVPADLLLLPDHLVAQLLTGLWLTDGYVSDPDRATAEVSYTSVSEQLAKDVRVLLLRLGLTSTIRRRKVHGSVVHTVALTRDAIRRCELPLVGRKAERLAALKVRLASGRARPMIDLIPPSFCAALPQRATSGAMRSRRQLALHAMSRETFLDFGGDPAVAGAEVMWSQVARVDDAGSAPCFDVTVDTEEHLYLADTFIVHNSAMVESIRWTLFGKARTPKDEVRTSDVKSDCVTEVEFEHEGHLYLVRRTLTGQNATPKAEAHWNGQQVAEGVTDVRRYVESVLGMDDTAFRASVFAEQKQVSAFSDVSPDKRRELVLRLLGITPLERARDLARSDARDSKKLHDNLQQKLPDLEELRGLLALAEDACTAREAEAKVADEATADAVAARDAADVAFEAADALRSDYERMVNEGKATVALLKETTERRAQLEQEQAELASAAEKIESLRPLVDGLTEREARLAGLRAVHAAEQALAKLPTGDAPAEPDETAVEAARAHADAASSEAADLQGALRGARAELERAEAAASRSATLSADENCPMCGQSLGEAFEQVQAHRHAEVTAAAERATALEQELAAATKRASTAKVTADAAAKALRTAQQAWATWQEQAGRRAAAEAALADALAMLVGGTPKEDELDALAAEVKAGKDASVELQRLEGRLDRRGAVDTELTALVVRIDELAASADELRARVKELGFKPEALAEAKAARDKARAAADARAKDAADAQAAAIKAAAAVDAAKERLAKGEADHAELASLVEEVRHTARTAELLSEFRNNVVQAIGPQLATQAADLFAELTDHEYEQLDVDAETFEIRIRDAGQDHGLARFSGSETDLANLALRIAISEHVRFQSGGAVGLLVLDEVFGPLDPDRKERMLQALNRLGSRFRQVLVITHDAEIKEQLPSAIEVVKLAGRRATARVLSGV